MWWNECLPLKVSDEDFDFIHKYLEQKILHVHYNFLLSNNLRISKYFQIGGN